MPNESETREIRRTAFTSELRYEKEMLEHKMALDEDAKNKELAAKKVMQQILAEQYKMEIEKKRKEKHEAEEKSKQQDTMSVQKLIHETDPNIILETFKNTGQTSSEQDLRWRQKGTGNLNFEARMTTINKQNQPNIVRDNYIRDQQRKQETLKYYSDMKEEGNKDRQIKNQMRVSEKDWEKRYISNELNIFQENQARQQALRDEQKRKYAEELKAQYHRDQEVKVNARRMTNTEKRLNYDNLQVVRN